MSDENAAPPIQVSLHALKAGRPRKWVAPADGEPMTPALKAAIHDREAKARAYAANRDAILEKTRVRYHARRQRMNDALATLKLVQNAVKLVA